jgi:hypothetical protein
MSTMVKASIEDVQEWAKFRGPELIRITKIRELSRHERRELNAIKEICPCHWTDHPRELSTNLEDCDICGRKM